MVRSLPTHLPPPTRPASATPDPADHHFPRTEALLVGRRVSSRVITIAGQEIQVGLGHADQTITVEEADTSFRVLKGGRFLIKVPCTTTKTVARFKPRKPEPLRNTAR